MPRLFRRLSVGPVVAAVIVAFVGLVSAVQPEPPTDGPHSAATMDPVNAARWRRSEAWGEDIRERQSIKLLLIGALIEGRVPLADVVAEFARLNAESGLAEVIQRGYPGTTPDERTVRNVLDYAAKYAPADRRAYVVERLEGEFAALYGRGVRASL